MKKNLLKTLTIATGALTALSPALVLTSCKKDKDDPEIEQGIEWDSGWYATNSNSTGHAKSDVVQVAFKLNKELDSGEKLSVELERIADKSTEGVTILHEDEQGQQTITVDKTDVKVPLRLQKDSSYQYFGEHVYYNITFTCSNGTREVWTKKIENCYFYLLLNPTITPWTRPLKAGETTNLTYGHNICVESGYTGATFVTTIEVTNKSPEWLPTLGVETSGSIVWQDIQTFAQPIKWSDTTRMVAGDWVEFNIHFTITVEALSDYPVTFDFNGFKLTYE